MSKGWIALDIDGTLVDGMQPIPAPVAKYLEKLHENGWKILFTTGRTYSFAEREIKTIKFPFYLSVQNGADILSMPEKVVIDSAYLDSEVLHHVEKAYRKENDDCVVYAGFEKGDFCYYRPGRFAPHFQDYFEKLQALCKQPWQTIASFDELSGIKFPLVKCLGSEKTVRSVSKKLEEIPGLEVIVIRDSVAPLFLGLVTDAHANKGRALHRILAKAGRKKSERVIAAGDDFNDISMLRLADIRIVMGTAPAAVQAEGDIIAKSAREMGILDALQEATGVVQ